MSTDRTHLTTHVLDASTGSPAAGLRVALSAVDPEVVVPAAVATTDADGRVARIGPGRLVAGTYRLVFETGEWFSRRGIETFYPQVEIVFVVDDVERHYHVPLLLSPYAYSTYRGS